MIRKYFLFLFFTLVYTQNYYLSPGFNVTFNEHKQVSFGCQVSIGMSYEIAQVALGVGAIYSVSTKEITTYNFFGGGITFIQYEYGNVKLSVNGKSKKGKRTNLSFGSPYLDAEFFHSIETSSLLDEKIIKRHNWIKFPIVIQ